MQLTWFQQYLLKKFLEESKKEDSDFPSTLSVLVEKLFSKSIDPSKNAQEVFQGLNKLRESPFLIEQSYTFYILGFCYEYGIGHDLSPQLAYKCYQESLKLSKP